MKRNITHKNLEDNTYTNFSYEEDEGDYRITLYFERIDENGEVFKKSINMNESMSLDLYNFLKAIYD